MNIFLAVALAGAACLPLFRGTLSVSLFFAALGAAVILQVVVIFFVGKPGTVLNKFGVHFTFTFGVPYVMFFLVSTVFGGTLIALQFSVFFFLCAWLGLRGEDPLE